MMSMDTIVVIGSSPDWKNSVMTEQTTLIANRYEFLEELGKGGMGTVYRVKDQLADTILALKRVLISTNRLNFNLSNSSQNQYIALASEFRTLSTLRHPHIISVQDYGFSADGQPYFTMEYLPNATSITDYARSQSEQVKIRLLTETLQALAYLHQRGIIHRDIKPGNILADQYGSVKVLDFGLAIAATTDPESETDRSTAGTVAYMAPELFAEPPSVQSDLYAVGLIAYEMFAGCYPFNANSFMSLLDDILRKQPDTSLIDSRLSIFIDKMIAKSPEMRPESARLAIKGLYAALEEDVPEESTTIRESFLQASSFVGRRAELNTFKDALQQLKKGISTAWLVGGESGSGKSRLVEELRTRALVEGVHVLRGQSAANSLPYQTWREVLRPLVLMTNISDLEAGILKEIVPDIGTLLNRSIPEVAQLTGKANQERLALSILDLFKQQADPTLLILEDLHWAGESIALLQTLLQQQQSLKLMIVGTYRTDEMAELPEQLPEMDSIGLERLDTQSVAELSQSMLGEAASDPQLLALINKETEGNIFFIVEVIRALAEEAGSLIDIGKTELPQRVMAGGMQQVLRRRLNRMPAWSQSMLKLAAIAGRQLDQAILKTAAPDTDIEAFVTEGANAAVFDVVDGNWRFAHDKLRETLLHDLADDEEPQLYRKVAESIETTYPDDVAYAEILAQHWDKAGNAEKMVRYTIQASERMVELTAEYDRAQSLLGRALEVIIADDPNYGLLHLYAGKTYERQADYDRAFDNYGASLEAARENQELKVKALLNMGNIKWQQSQLDIAEQYLTEAMQLGTALDKQELIADALFFQGRLADAKGDFPAAYAFFEQSLQIERKLQRVSKTSSTLTELGVISARLGNLDQAKSYFEQGLAIQRKIQDKYNVAISQGNLGFVALLQQDYDLAYQHTSASHKILQELGSRDGEALALIDLGSIAIARQQYEEAISCFEQSLAINREIGNASGIIIALNEQANLYLSQEDIWHAKTKLLESLKLAHQIEATPYLLMAIAFVARLYFSEEDFERSAALASFCAAHEAMPADERERYVEPLQADLQTKMDEKDYEAASQIGQDFELANVVDELVTTLAVHEQARSVIVVMDDTNVESLQQLAALYFGELVRYQEVQFTSTEASQTLAEFDNLIELAQTAYIQGELSEAAAHLERTTLILATVDDPVSKSCNLGLLGQLAMTHGDFDTARRYLEEKVTLNRSQGNIAEVAKDLLNIGITYAYQGELIQADDYFEQSLAAHPEPPLVALGLAGLGLTALLREDFEIANGYLSESAQTFQGISDMHGEAVVLYFLGTAMLAHHQPAVAIQQFERSLTLSQHPLEVVKILLREAHAYLLDNKLALAQKNILESLTKAQIEGSSPHMLAAIGAAARLFFAQDKFNRSAELISLCRNNPTMPIDDLLWYLTPIETKLEDTLGHLALTKMAKNSEEIDLQDVVRKVTSELTTS